jgi:hypothetical protein
MSISSNGDPKFTISSLQVGSDNCPLAEDDKTDLNTKIQTVLAEAFQKNTALKASKTLTITFTAKQITIKDTAMPAAVTTISLEDSSTTLSALKATATNICNVGQFVLAKNTDTSLKAYKSYTAFQTACQNKGIRAASFAEQLKAFSGSIEASAHAPTTIALNVQGPQATAQSKHHHHQEIDKIIKELETNHDGYNLTAVKSLKELAEKLDTSKPSYQKSADAILESCKEMERIIQTQANLCPTSKNCNTAENTHTLFQKYHLQEHGGLIQYLNDWKNPQTPQDSLSGIKDGVMGIMKTSYRNYLNPQLQPVLQHLRELLLVIQVHDETPTY